MRLTPIDLINKRFPTAVKGYSRAAVEDYLREVAADYEGTVAENARLRDCVEALEREVERFRSIEKTLHDALLLAQRTSDELRATAHREADAILQEARVRAETQIDDAHFQLEGLRQQRARFAREFRALLRAHLDGLDCDDVRSAAGGLDHSGILEATSALVSAARDDAGTGELAAGG